jgi:ribosomal protein S26
MSDRCKHCGRIIPKRNAVLDKQIAKLESATVILQLAAQMLQHQMELDIARFNSATIKKLLENPEAQYLLNQAMLNARLNGKL